MPAPLAILYAVEPAVETALVARFNSQLTMLPAYKQRQAFDLTGTRIEVEFTTNGQTDHLRPNGDGTFARDLWRYTLQVRLCTVRRPLMPDAHGFYRGRIREIVTAARYDPAFLRHHVLSTMSEQAGTESIIAPDDTDESVIVFTGLIGIRPDAWPR